MKLIRPIEDKRQTSPGIVNPRVSKLFSLAFSAIATYANAGAIRLANRSVREYFAPRPLLHEELYHPSISHSLS